ncbi:hypothetical protein HII31_09344 [Pseudocercospora fuligena]|uniref:C2H2-type domain-containing protein n=1 Tax=Pseudocercospora fuligena TaxID=685502 RepID=A0A8H6RG00_9PEZI|nr:hypothetical protein HII31_09344 [Pseudocercospora fuligena]
MADFNSSDIEFSDHETSARVGKRAIESIIQQSVSDRIASKKVMKQLKDNGSAPSTTISRSYWHELFKSFAQHTLHIGDRPFATPTGEDIARFIAQLPDHLQSRHDDGKTAWTLIKSAEVSLDRSLSFHFPDFKLSKHEALRIDATIQKLIDDGKVTKDLVREKQWLTCQVMKRMITVIFEDAINNGTKSWDVTLAGCLGLALQAAITSRAGDFRRSSHYQGEQYLKWENIELKATGDRENPRLAMLVTLYFRKGFKRDSSKATKIELRQLPSDEDSAVDVTKLLVAYALRVGAVQETNWVNLIDAVLSRPSRRFIWQKPSTPVFYAYTKSQQLDFDNPAPVDQQNRFLRRGASLMGMLQLPVSHDIRRGSAADAYSLESFGNAENARMSLGHGNSSLGKGITDEYIGRHRADTWSARTAGVAAKPDEPFGIQVADVSYKKRKLATADIDRYCENNGLPKDERGSREKARQALQKMQHAQWAAHQQSLMNASAVRPELHEASERVPLQDITNQHRARAFKINGPAKPVKTKETTSLVHETPSAISVVVENIDPALRVFSSVVGLSQTEDDEIDATTNVVESLAAEYTSVVASGTSDLLPMLTAPIDQFIHSFSTINVFSVATDKLPSGAPAGNSRDAPSKFKFVCFKSGCTNDYDSSLRRDQHMANCRGRSTHLDARPPGDESPEPAPSSSRKRKKAEVDPGFPQHCPDRNDCGVQKDFTTARALKTHRNKYHDESWPENTPCNVPGCQMPPDHYFISRVWFAQHLQNYHMLSAIDARPYIDKILPAGTTLRAARGAAERYTATTCLFADCKSSTKFAKYDHYIQHLRMVHKLKAGQFTAYMPAADVAADDEV